MSKSFKPGDTVTVYLYEKVAHETTYVLSAEDFDEDGDLDESAIESVVIDTIDWNLCTIMDRSIQVYSCEGEKV